MWEKLRESVKAYYLAGYIGITTLFCFYTSVIRIIVLSATIVSKK